MAVMTRQGPVTSQTDIELTIHASHWNPFTVLGLHEIPGGSDGVEGVGHPGVPARSRTAWVVDLLRGEPGEPVAMERIHPDGFFRRSSPTDPAVLLPARLENHEGHQWEFVDPYAFGPVLTDFDLHLLGEGTHYRNYERLGAHLRTHEGFRGVHFAVWAPNAERVSVTGNFNHWDGRRHPMGTGAVPASGSCSSPTLRRARSTSSRSRAGTTATSCRRPIPTGSPPSSAPRPPRSSGISPSSPGATRNGWRRGAQRQALDRPIAFYEVHLGSWKEGGDAANGFLNYRELADATGRAPRAHPVHPRRAAADHRASVRRKLGLPAGRLLRADLAARHARTTSPTSSTTCTGTASG